MTVAPASYKATQIEPYVWRIAGVALLGSVMSLLDTTIVNVALRTLSRDLHSSITQTQWVVTGYLLALAVVIPVSGWAARRLGAKRIYMVSLRSFTAGSALCGLADSTGTLVIFRVLQGPGGGMIGPVGQMIIAREAGPQRGRRPNRVIAVPASTTSSTPRMVMRRYALGATAAGNRERPVTVGAGAVWACH